jgi:pentatricopeptide repeat protein
MLAPFDIAVSAIGVCAVAMIMLFDFRSGDDVQSGIVAKLLVFAFAALWVLSLFRRKALATNELIPSREAQFDVSEHVELMKKYASERNIVGAMRTFRLMKQKGELSSLVYNTMLQAHINSGNMYAAEDWMDEIKEAGMADELSFHILVKALVTAHALQKAYDLLKEMSQAGVKPQIATFNEVLGGFARENQVDEALALLEEMHTQGVEPTSVTLNAIVKLMNGSRHSNLKLVLLIACSRSTNLRLSRMDPGRLSGGRALIWPRLRLYLCHAFQRWSLIQILPNRRRVLMMFK